MRKNIKTAIFIIAGAAAFAAWLHTASRPYDRITVQASDPLIRQTPLLPGVSYADSLPESRTSGQKIDLLFFGDLMVGRHVKENIDAQDGSITHIFSDLAGEEGLDFFSYDLVGANLEGALTGQGRHYPPDNIYDFAFDPEIVKQFKDYNFNFFSLANNHLADQGERGIIETRKILDDLGFFYAGDQDRAVSEKSARTIRIKGRVLGLAAYSQVYGLLDEQAMLKQVKELDGQSDFLVVQMHWGREYEHYSGSIQKRIGRQLIEAGADMVVGHHPHVVQGMEIHQGKPVFYSLGNFIFDQYFSPDTQSGLALGAVWSRDGLTIKLLPFKSANNRLKLLSGRPKQDFFEDFLLWSRLEEDPGWLDKDTGEITIYANASF